jgi:hypothetical protein
MGGRWKYYFMVDGGQHGNIILNLLMSGNIFGFVEKFIEKIFFNGQK